jgi:hypothetical protein
MSLRAIFKSRRIFSQADKEVLRSFQWNDPPHNVPAGAAEPSFLLFRNRVMLFLAAPQPSCAAIPKDSKSKLGEREESDASNQKKNRDAHQRGSHHSAKGNPQKWKQSNYGTEKRSHFQKDSIVNVSVLRRTKEDNRPP